MRRAIAWLPAHPGIWLTPVLAADFLYWVSQQDRNRALFLTLNGLAARLPDALWSGLTALGDTLVALVLLLPLLRRRPDWVMAALLAALPATLISHGLKDWVDAARPAAVVGEAVHVIGPLLKAGAFPSGHTTTAFVLAAVLVMGLRSAAASVAVVLAAHLLPGWRMAKAARGEG